MSFDSVSELVPDDNPINNNELRVSFISPISQSPNPSTPPSSKHARRPSLVTQQRQQQQRQESQLQFSPESLARHGIKVRDFAYESNLPSIPSIPRVRQLSLAARPLKRTKRQNEQSDDIFANDARSQSQSDAPNPFWAALVEPDHDRGTTGGIPNTSKPLERKSTEPAITPVQERQRPFRDVGYTDLSQRASSSQTRQKSPLNTPTPVTPTPNRFRTSAPAALFFPFPTTFGESQGTEPSIDTPLATPKGSLTWPTIASDVPASQLDGGSQPPVVEDTTYSQLGFSAPSSQALDSNPDLGGTDPSSPRPTEPASSPPQPPPRRLNGARAPSPLSPLPRSRALGSLTESGAPNLGTPPSVQNTATTTTPRYFLRKHGTPAQAPASPGSPQRKRVSSSSKVAARYPGRVPAVTRQAAHAAVSGSGGRSSHARPLRKTTLP